MKVPASFGVFLLNTRANFLLHRGLHYHRSCPMVYGGEFLAYWEDDLADWMRFHSFEIRLRVRVSVF